MTMPLVPAFTPAQSERCLRRHRCKHRPVASVMLEMSNTRRAGRVSRPNAIVSCDLGDRQRTMLGRLEGLDAVSHLYSLPRARRRDGRPSGSWRRDHAPPGRRRPATASYRLAEPPAPIASAGRIAPVTITGRSPCTVKSRKYAVPSIVFFRCHASRPLPRAWD